jgi:hypothetical protein
MFFHFPFFRGHKWFGVPKWWGYDYIYNVMNMYHHWWRIFHIWKPLFILGPLFLFSTCFFSKGMRVFVFEIPSKFSYEEELHKWARFRDASITDVMEPLQLSSNFDKGIFHSHAMLKRDKPRKVYRDKRGGFLEVTVPYFTWDSFTFARLYLDFLGKKSKNENFNDALSREIGRFSDLEVRILLKGYLNRFTKQGEEWRLWQDIIVGRENLVDVPYSASMVYDEKTDKYKIRWEHNAFRTKEVVKKWDETGFRIANTLFMEIFEDVFSNNMRLHNFFRYRYLTLFYTDLWNYYYNDVYNDFYRIDRIDYYAFPDFKEYMDEFKFNPVKYSLEADAVEFELKLQVDKFYIKAKKMHDEVRSFFYRIDKELFNFNLPKWAFHRNFNFMLNLSENPFVNDPLFAKIQLNDFISKNSEDYNKKHRANLDSAPVKLGKNVASKFYGIADDPYIFESWHYWFIACVWTFDFVIGSYGFFGRDYFTYFFDWRLFANILFGGWDISRYMADVTAYSSYFYADLEYNPHEDGQGFRYHHDPYFSEYMSYGYPLEKQYPDTSVVTYNVFYAYKFFLRFIYPLFYGQHGLWSPLCEFRFIIFFYYFFLLFFLIKWFIQPVPILVKRARWLNYQDVLKVSSYFKLKKKLRRGFLWFWQ